MLWFPVQVLRNVLILHSLFPLFSIVLAEFMLTTLHRFALTTAIGFALTTDVELKLNTDYFELQSWHYCRRDVCSYCIIGALQLVIDY